MYFVHIVPMYLSVNIYMHVCICVHCVVCVVSIVHVYLYFPTSILHLSICILGILVDTAQNCLFALNAFVGVTVRVLPVFVFYIIGADGTS
jgi:hypothetical protein